MRLCAWLEQSKKTTHLARQNRQMVSLFCQLSDMLYTTTPLSPAAEKSVRGNSYICPRNSPLVSEVLSWLMTLSNCQLSQYWAINNLCMSILVAYTVVWFFQVSHSICLLLHLVVILCPSVLLSSFFPCVMMHDCWQLVWLLMFVWLLWTHV